MVQMCNLPGAAASSTRERSEVIINIMMSSMIQIKGHVSNCCVFYGGFKISAICVNVLSLPRVQPRSQIVVMPSQNVKWSPCSIPSVHSHTRSSPCKVTSLPASLLVARIPLDVPTPNSPQRHPKQPLTTWMPQSTTCSMPMVSRMEKRTTCHITTFSGNSHFVHRVWLTR
ncbi:hypothetical protein INR49_025514 [Caranx melampygus]|nr:hypothetical protein INR49_025514 [Caranx melampygus]